MSKKETALRAIVETIPQWYFGTIGPFVHSLSYDGSSVNFCSHRALTPDLNSLRTFAETQLHSWVSQMPSTPTPSALGKIREDLALFWLSKRAPKVNWAKMLAYAEWLRFRTYENQPVSLNLIISPGAGTIDITDESIQKTIDPLASSQNAFFRIDYSGQFLDYEQVSWQETNEPADYKFNPDFVQPFVSQLGDEDLAFHVTPRRDIIILDRHGMLAAYRRGNWYVYAVSTLKNSITHVTGHYRVGCNLFDVVFDLSYRRHGALLVYDPGHNVIKHVVNKGSVIMSGSTPDVAHSMLAPAVHPIRMGDPRYEKRKKRILLEIASIDGAVIFDEYNVLAFGAMIATHPDAGGHAGARTTAARSAHLFGGIPVKISSDGDISLLFKTNNAEGMTADAELRFM